MKALKRLAVVIAAAAICLPLFSGCGKGQVVYTLSEEGGEKHYVVSCTGRVGSIKGEYIIAAYHGAGDSYAPVTEIAEGAFENCGLSGIEIPNTVKKIGTAAFSYSRSLRHVRFDAGSRLEEISHGAFGVCISLEEIELPSSVKVISSMAFYSCERLTSVTLGGHVTQIGTQAFEQCVSLESINLPQGLTTIGLRAFSFSGLKSITVPGTVKESTKTGTDGKDYTVYGIGYAAFHSCTQLETVTVEEGVKAIPAGAFGYCTALKTLYLPASLEEVGGAYYPDGSFYCGHAFHSDAALENIYYGGTAAQWAQINIDNKACTEGGVTFDNTALQKATKHYTEL